jgi:hypothetical protein
LEEAAAPSIADSVDDNYWDMPSEPAYGGGMTVARKVMKECAVEHLQERIRLAKRKAAEPDPLLCATDVAIDYDSRITSDDGCDHDNYWDWHTPEHPHRKMLENSHTLVQLRMKTISIGIFLMTRRMVLSLWRGKKKESWPCFVS